MSAVHLGVGVVYCLISWGVGLPKRAVMSLLLHACIISTVEIEQKKQKDLYNLGNVLRDSRYVYSGIIWFTLIFNV